VMEDLKGKLQLPDITPAITPPKDGPTLNTAQPKKPVVRWIWKTYDLNGKDDKLNDLKNKVPTENTVKTKKPVVNGKVWSGRLMWLGVDNVKRNYICDCQKWETIVYGNVKRDTNLVIVIEKIALLIQYWTF
jgi:hypothetical protein